MNMPQNFSRDLRRTSLVPATPIPYGRTENQGGLLTTRLMCPSDLDRMITRLAEQGYRVLGPRLENDVIALGELASARDLPRGVRDDQRPGRYRTTQSGEGGYFEYAVGPTSLKPVLFPPRRPVWISETSDGEVHFRSAIPSEDLTAVIGVRPCDLAAVAAQDRVLLDGPYIDPDYSSRRSRLFVVVVDCARPADTCFCTSMGTGPSATEGFDVALTEIRSADRHFFLAEAGSESGESLLDHLDARDAAPDDVELGAAILRAASDSIDRTLDTGDLHDLLQANPDHPQWASIAERCLSCANCTMVCPTCFCVTTVPVSNLVGQSGGQDRQWDSCFSLDYSFVGDSPVRTSAESRYRQWLTHKLSTWIDQFGSSGCVGCGRCITWCPVGIDLTHEIPKIREAAHA